MSSLLFQLIDILVVCPVLISPLKYGFNLCMFTLKVPFLGESPLQLHVEMPRVIVKGPYHLEFNFSRNKFSLELNCNTNYPCGNIFV